MSSAFALDLPLSFSMHLSVALFEIFFAMCLLHRLQFSVATNRQEQVDMQVHVILLVSFFVVA